jgi:amidase
MTPHPPIVRGLRHLVEKLRKAGHVVVNWQGPLRTRDFIRIGDTLTLSGAREDSRSAHPELKQSLLHPVLAAIESTQEPIWPEIAEKFDLYGPKKDQATPYDIWQLHLEKQALIEWFHTTWQSTRGYSTTGRPIDGLIL